MFESEIFLHNQINTNQFSSGVGAAVVCKESEGNRFWTEKEGRGFTVLYIRGILWKLLQYDKRVNERYWTFRKLHKIDKL